MAAFRKSVGSQLVFQRAFLDILEDYGTLISELQSFVGRYGLDGDASSAPSENGSGGEKEIEEEELELVAYLDLS